MRPSRSILLALVLVCVGLVANIGTASADVGPGDANCAHGNYQTQTNDWHFFYVHKLRLSEAVCHAVGNGDATHQVNYPKFNWVKTPVLSTPSVGPIPSAEKITIVRQPYVYSIYRHYGDIVSVHWHFTAKNQFSTFDFSYVVNQTGTHICAIGGSCDDWKRW